jgi:hypothetical protein
LLAAYRHFVHPHNRCNQRCNGSPGLVCASRHATGLCGPPKNGSPADRPFAACHAGPDPAALAAQAIVEPSGNLDGYAQLFDSVALHEDPYRRYRANAMAIK